MAVGEAVKKGILKAQPGYQIDVLSVSDGGEGFLTSLNQNSDFEINTLDEGKDLLLRDAKFQYGILNNHIYLESALSCGIELLEREELDPTKTTSYGLGLGIKKLIGLGYTRFTLGLGGSATNDGGAGLLAGLGFRFFNAQDEEFIPSGGNLNEIKKILPSTIDFSQVKFTLATDVNNLLLGENGATYTFGKQKGGTDLEFLEKGMKHFASFFTNQHNMQVGSGAAGGIGYSLMNIIQTQVKPGAQVLYEALDLLETLPQYDLIISGEGKIDNQTNQGKWVDFISKICHELQKDLVLICGTSKLKTYLNYPILKIRSIEPDLQLAQKNATELLEELAFNYFSR